MCGRARKSAARRDVGRGFPSPRHAVSPRRFPVSAHGVTMMRGEEWQIFRRGRTNLRPVESRFSTLKTRVEKGGLGSRGLFRAIEYVTWKFRGKVGIPSRHSRRKLMKRFRCSYNFEHPLFFPPLLSSPLPPFPRPRRTRSRQSQEEVETSSDPKLPLAPPLRRRAAANRNRTQDQKKVVATHHILRCHHILPFG